jgi:NAD-dependent deacetylase
MKCGSRHSAEFVKKSEGAPRCVCGGAIKPDVVLYEESLDNGALEDSVEAIRRADLLVVGGTSLVVYPAAGLLKFFGGNSLVLINKTETSFDGQASLVINESIGAVLDSVL